MKRIRIMLLIVLITPLITNYLYSKTIKIFMIHSYNYYHICTAPQREGFLEQLRAFSLTSGYLHHDPINFIIKGFYMKTKFVYTTKREIKARAKIAIQECKQFNPDYVFITDDNAFRYAGIPLSKQYKVLFSGLNKPFPEYLRYTNVNVKNVCGVEELINLEPLLNMFDRYNIYFNKIYLLTTTAKDATPTAKYKLLNFIDELENSKYANRYQLVIVKDYNDLVTTLKFLNKKPLGLLIIILHRLRSNDGSFIKKPQLLKTIIRYNNKHVELDINENFIKLGVAFGYITSFYQMGLTAATILTNELNSSSEYKIWGTSGCIIRVPNKCLVNIARMKQLGYYHLFSELINTHCDVIDKIFTIKEISGE